MEYNGVILNLYRKPFEILMNSLTVQWFGTLKIAYYILLWFLRDDFFLPLLSSHIYRLNCTRNTTIGIPTVLNVFGFWNIPKILVYHYHLYKIFQKILVLFYRVINQICSHHFFYLLL